MPSATMTQVLGTTRSWKLTARSNGQPVLGVFTALDSLFAKVYRGKGQVPLLTPTPAWIDPAAGTLQLTITAADLAAAAIEDGLYQIEVGVTRASDLQPRDILKGLIKFEGTTGTAGLPTSWVTYKDMTDRSAKIETLQDEDEDLTGFANQRNLAMEECIAFIARRYSPQPGRSMRFTNEDGTGPGPYLRWAPPPPGQVPPTREQVVAWLEQPVRVHLTEDLIAANALLAAALVYAAAAGKNNPYSEQAAADRAAGLEALRRAFVEVDTSQPPDGVWDVRITQDVVYLA